MQLIPDGLNITTGYHVFETPDDIIINSQIYDKVDMKPKDYHFWNTNYCLNNKNLLLHECNVLEYEYTNPSKEPNYEYYIQDNQDTNIFYCITEKGPSDSNQYFLKLKKSDNSYELLSSISPDSGYRPQSISGIAFTYLHYKLLGQTNNYVILYQENVGANSYWSGSRYTDVNRNNQVYHSFSYIAINKSTMEFKKLNVSNNQKDLGIFKIKETNNAMYLMENLSGIIKIVKYIPDSNNRNVLNTIPFQDNYGIYLGIANIIPFLDSYLTLTGGDNHAYFVKIDINFSNDTVNSFLYSEIFNIPYNQNNANYNQNWIRISLSNIDDKYICVTVHDNQNVKHFYTNTYHEYNYYETATNGSIVAQSQTIFSNSGKHRHYLFKHEPNNSIKLGYKGIINPETQDQHIYGVLYLNQYTPIFFMNNKIAIYEFNLDEESYEKKFDLPGIYNTVGLDSNNNLYVFDQSNKCTIYNTYSSNELDVKFAKKEYKYNNENIYTYVSVYAKNILGSYINVNVKITLSGNCTFDNGSQELYTNTSESGSKNIPVTITYGGRIYCYIEEV